MKLINLEDSIDRAIYRVRAISLIAEGIHDPFIASALSAVSVDVLEHLEEAHRIADKLREADGCAHTRAET